MAGCGADEVTLPETDPTPLPLPPLAPSRVEDGVRVFDLEAQARTLDLLPGRPTPTAGFASAGRANGYLGPTLRAARGESVRVRFRNRLDVHTTVHWHGMHLPPAMDGGPHQMVAPGGEWSPQWRVDQPAATLWYHPHPHGSTQDQVNLGMAGLFLLDDPDAEPAGLPGDYGVDDFPVIVQDKRVGDDGTFLLDSSGNEIGILGETLLVNGARRPYVEVTTQRIRLRLLNASPARTYYFTFADGREFAMIASDGGLLPSPVPLTGIRLSPAERAEIVVELEPGERVRLRSVRPDLGGVAAPFAFGGEDEFDVLELRAAARLTASSPLPTALTAVPRRSEDEAVEQRFFTLTDRRINGRTMDMARVDEVVRVGSTEVWEVRSTNPFPHNFHVHDVQFQVASIDGAAPPPELTGWKDTVYLEPGRRYRLLLRFDDYASAEVPYMYHCHLLLHEDEGMMGQFLVVEEGTVPSRTLGSAPGHSH